MERSCLGSRKLASHRMRIQVSTVHPILMELRHPWRLPCNNSTLDIRANPSRHRTPRPSPIRGLDLHHRNDSIRKTVQAAVPSLPTNTLPRHHTQLFSNMTLTSTNSFLPRLLVPQLWACPIVPQPKPNSTSCTLLSFAYGRYPPTLPILKSCPTSFHCSPRSSRRSHSLVSRPSSLPPSRLPNPRGTRRKNQTWKKVAR